MEKKKIFQKFAPLKLLRFCVYRGMSSPFKKKLKSTNVQNVLIFKNNLYFDFYRFLLFLRKIKRIVNYISKQKGLFALINNFKMASMFQNLCVTKNLLYLDYDKRQLTDPFFFKTQLKVVKNFDSPYLKLKKISFLIITLKEKISLLENRKILNFKKKHYPTLLLSENPFNACYYLPCSANAKTAYFWIFILAELLSKK